jgi:hypothetical protein
MTTEYGLDSPHFDSRKWRAEELSAARMRASILFLEVQPYLSPAALFVLEDADIRAWSGHANRTRITIRWSGLKVRTSLSRVDAAGGEWLARCFEELARELRRLCLQG